MTNQLFTFVIDILTLAALFGGTFFMFLAAFGIVRMPDFYHRMHAGTKGATLGLLGLMLAVMFNSIGHHDASVLTVVTRVVLVITFTFIANPVGAHLLSKAAHLDGCPQWSQTIKDELEQDDQS